MTTIAFYVMLQLLVSGYACWRGGAPERAVALMMVAAVAASAAAPFLQALTFRSVAWDLFWIDVAFLVGVVAVAAVADRFWPLWFAALQLIAVASHGVRAYDRSGAALAYWYLVVKIAYPLLIILAVGTARHHARQRRGLPDYGWTFERHRDERGGFQADRAQR